MPTAIVVTLGVHEMASGEVYTVDVAVPATHWRPPQATLVHLMVGSLLVSRSVHDLASVDVRIDIKPAATQIDPFHAIADLGSRPATD